MLCGGLVLAIRIQYTSVKFDRTWGCDPPTPNSGRRNGEMLNDTLGPKVRGEGEDAGVRNRFWNHKPFGAHAQMVDDV